MPVVTRLYGLRLESLLVVLLDTDSLLGGHRLAQGFVEGFGTLLPLQGLWYYVVLGFMMFGFVLCGIGTATSIRKHLQV